MAEPRIAKLQDLPVLLDIYGCLLTEKQREALSLCYEEDCTLAEIAELHGSSRQAAHNLLERGEAQLRAYEDALQMAAAERARAEIIEELKQLVRVANIATRDRMKIEELLCRL